MCQGDKAILNTVYCIENLLTYMAINWPHLTFLSKGQWHLTPTLPAPTTPPPRPPAPSTPPTTMPGTTLVLQPRLSHSIVASGQPTSPQEGLRQRGVMWPLWAGPHRDTGSRVEEIKWLTDQGSSQLRNTEPGTGWSAYLNFVFKYSFLLFFWTFMLILFPVCFCVKMRATSISFEFFFNLMWNSIGFCYDLSIFILVSC